jgi:lipopolysaccharide/colanic/teichoic acid biosynthesis glycosyltransferase
MSLDELPQLVNVLVGDMSLIGPRPYFPGELGARPEAEVILRVRPGITGLWQVNGRADRTFEERVQFDVQYVNERGFAMDARIMARTVGAVLSGRGAY